jgi:hypothetical protein
VQVIVHNLTVVCGLVTAVLTGDKEVSGLTAVIMKNVS